MFDATNARDLGRKGGRAKRKLTLERIEQELPPLDSIEHAMERLDTVGRWALAGLTPGAIASAVVRSCEVWVKANESKMTREVVETLRARLEALEGQLKAPRVGLVP